MRADARVKAYALNDLLRAQTARFGVGVELIEEADAQGKVGVCENFTASASVGFVYRTGISSFTAPCTSRCAKVCAAFETLITGRRADDYT